jgi:Flp pilus assembly protein TadD
LLRVGQADQALESANAAIRLDPGQDRAHELKGRSLLARGELDAAEAALAEATRLRPGNQRARRWLAHTLFKQGRFQHALTLSRRAARFAPRDTDAQILYAVNLAKGGQLDQAFKQIEQACTSERPLAVAAPGFRRGGPAPAGGTASRPEAKGGRDGTKGRVIGTVRPASGTPRVVYDFKEQWSRKSAGQSRTLFRLKRMATDAEKRGDLERMARMTTFLVAVGGRSSRHYAERLGKIAVGKNRCGEAVQTLEQASARFPDDPKLVYYLGRCYLGLGNRKAFDTLCAELGRRERGKAESLLCRCRLEVLDGNLDAAERSLEAALKAGWGSTDQLAKIKDLAPLLERRRRSGEKKKR